jgi:hypothetical protein
MLSLTPSVVENIRSHQPSILPSDVDSGVLLAEVCIAPLLMMCQ